MEETPRKEHRKKKKKRRETVEVKMDYVPGTEGDFRPFVSYFPTGFDPVAKSEGVAAAGEESTGLADIRVYRGSDRLKAKQHQLVMATSQGQVDFVGMNYTAEAAAWQPCSYFIGVFDKEKGSLKLVPLGGEKVPTLLLLSLLLSLAWFFSLGREKDDRRKRINHKTS
jgi:DNA-directed RNA polymerase I subunit RPA49